jgi:hypothetical protein
MAFTGKPTNANELILWDGTEFFSGKITDTNVSATAAIAGTKISPNFGSQTILTTGNITVGGGSAVNSILGSAVYTTKTFSSTGTIDTSTKDYIVYADTSGGAFTLTLPAPTNGRFLILKD